MMSWLLPYLCLSLLLVGAIIAWTLQILKQRSEAQTKLVEQLRRARHRGVHTQRELADRIFDSQDWEFVSCETSLEIQKVFQKERAVLAICWLQRARSETSHALWQNAKAIARSKNVELYTKKELVVNYSLFLVLCSFLIVLIRFRGAFATQRGVNHALHLNARLCNDFKDLIMVVEAARPIYSDANFGRREIRLLEL
jgi:hypothetical protein